MFFNSVLKRVNDNIRNRWINIYLFFNIMIVNYFIDSFLRLISWYFFFKEINIKIIKYVIIFYKF